MKIVFVSTTYNHHQSEVSQAFFHNPEIEYTFIETMPLDDGRKALKWGIEDYPEFVRCSHINKNEYNDCVLLINEADVVIWGSAPFKMIKSRLRKGKFTIHYSERLFKKGFSFKEFVPRMVKHFYQNLPFYNQYLLCASAYAAYDYRKIGCFKNKMFKWGYFPKFVKYNIDELIEQKNKQSILWVGRMIDWKHPEYMIVLAEALAREDVNFHIKMIGTGYMLETINKMIEDKKLNRYVTLLGAMKPDEVRDEMKRAAIVVSTSDCNEGWGAVINEAMNSGCALVASQSMGAVPYLIENEVSGLVYAHDDSSEMIKCVKKLLNDSILQKKIAMEAYNVIASRWNADKAVSNLLLLIKTLKEEGQVDITDDSPCSKAYPILSTE